MKSAIHTLFAIIISGVTASAAPTLLVETTITERATKKVLAQPHLAIESGKQSIIVAGDFEYRVTPTLTADGRISFKAALLRGHGKKAELIQEADVLLRPGQAFDYKVDKVDLSNKITLQK